MQTDRGAYVRDWEQARIDTLVADVFGYNALQVGLPGLDLLRANRMPFKAYAGSVLQEGAAACAPPGATVLANAEALPFDTESIDLLVLPHGLETTDFPHEVLREVERVLVHEGRVVITGFNPWSLWGIRNRLPWMPEWLPQSPDTLVSLHRLKDWLKLLSLDVDRGHFGCYVPAFRSSRWIERFSFLEQAGDRWWPVCGAVYMVSATKRAAGMRLIGAPWKKKPLRARAAQAAGVMNRGEPNAPGAMRDRPNPYAGN